MVYGLAMFIFKIFYGIFYRMRVIGAENVPNSGAIVLCGNHSSYHDPLALAICVKRQVHFIGKSTLFKKGLVNATLRALGAIPVERGKTGMSSFKECLAVLEKNNVLGIFAQGRRVSEADDREAKAGVALFAIKGGAVIVPVNITSTFKLFSKVHITFGKPVDVEKYRGRKVRSTELNEITGRVMDAIIALTPGER